MRASQGHCKVVPCRVAAAYLLLCGLDPLISVLAFSCSRRHFEASVIWAARALERERVSLSLAMKIQWQAAVRLKG